MPRNRQEHVIFERIQRVFIVQFVRRSGRALHLVHFKIVDTVIATATVYR